MLKVKRARFSTAVEVDGSSSHSLFAAAFDELYFEQGLLHAVKAGTHIVIPAANIAFLDVAEVVKPQTQQTESKAKK